VLPAPSPADGWSLVEAPPFYDYQPRFRGQRGTLYQTYQREDGALLALYIAYYAEQRPGNQMVTSVNRLNYREETGPVNWQLISTRLADMPPGRIQRTIISDRDRILAAWHWYWNGGSIETNDRRAKIAFATQRLTRQADDAAFVAVLTPTPDRSDDARELVEAFLRDHAPAIEALLDEAKARQ